MTKRKNDKTIETKIINIEKNTSTIKTRNLFNQVIDVKQEKKIQFDPRTRPWYKGAKEFEQRYWTDVYMFFTDKKPGITAAYPAFDKFDKFYGVFGIDIRLDKISEFLKIQRFSEKSTIFIINDKNKIVAYPNLKEINQKIIGTTPPSIKDISSPLIKEAFKVKANKLGDKFNFDYQDATYYVSFSKFPEHFGKKWRLVIISPEKDIFPTGNDEQYILYSVLFFVLLFTVLTGTILHKKIFQYIATITYDIKKVASGQYNTPLTTKSSTPEIQGVTTALDKLKESLKENQTN